LSLVFHMTADSCREPDDVVFSEVAKWRQRLE